jgi:hypothetical protein
MRIATAEKQVYTNFESEGSDFKLKASGKMFHMFINGIYQYKIAAVIRELCANAYDSHIEAGKENVPFIVVLPNASHPYFEVEDMGIGMTKDTAFNLYPVLGESSKEFTNDLAGAFGIGSKTPFAYTSQFTVTCRKDGMEFTGIAYLQDSGTPRLDQLNYVPTDKPNGLKVTVPVNANDIQAFESEASFWLSFYDTKAIVRKSGFTLNTEQDFNQCVMTAIPLLAISSRLAHNHKYFAKMGPIVYPFALNDSGISDSDQQMIQVFMQATSSAFIFDFDIGELQLNPSRENLSLDNNTVNNLGKNLLGQFKVYRNTIEKKLEGYDHHPVSLFNRLVELKSELGYGVCAWLWRNNYKDLTEKYSRYPKSGILTKIWTKRYSRKKIDHNTASYLTIMPVSHHPLFDEKIDKVRLLHIEKEGAVIISKLIDDATFRVILKGKVSDHHIRKMSMIIGAEIELISYTDIYAEYLADRRTNRPASVRGIYEKDTIVASGLLIRNNGNKVVVETYNQQRITLEPNVFYVESHNKLEIEYNNKCWDMADNFIPTLQGCIDPELFKDYLDSLNQEDDEGNSCDEIVVVRKNKTNSKRIDKHKIPNLSQLINEVHVSASDIFKSIMDSASLRLKNLHDVYQIDPSVFNNDETLAIELYDKYNVHRKGVKLDWTDGIGYKTILMHNDVYQTAFGFKSIMDNVSKTVYHKHTVHDRIDEKYPISSISKNPRGMFKDQDELHDHSLIYIKAMVEHNKV